MSHIVGQVSQDEMDYFSNIRATIAGHAIFPAKRIDNKMTINGARGVNHKIQDRFDLTLEGPSLSFGAIEVEGLT